MKILELDMLESHNTPPKVWEDDIAKTACFCILNGSRRSQRCYALSIQFHPIEIRFEWTSTQQRAHLPQRRHCKSTCIA